ncbi:NAD(P)-dependent malic enzyme [Vagococcus luciliae]|uniref:NAD-dependent malic enzyme n=1 Tax=Vagococcus luciliae TaxID=2920380 RepID=A0ABY5P056_9ENTE|nr:NADP-dependent malic enzyme [Vagococcus luciliae]UUV99157.1 NAD-dependent malic enzyme [Vagococcus luciliae]
MNNEILELHHEHIGVLSIQSELPVKNGIDLAKAYTPGVAELSKLIEKHNELAREYTISGKLVAVISDGSAVLGLGNVGPQAGLPIVEGKSLLYKTFANVDAIPMAIDQVEIDAFVETIKNMSHSFAGIHLEDIQAPRCFEIEDKLKELLDIPVYHDDQEGTAIVVLAGLINAAKVSHRKLSDLKIVLNGVGASGVATAKLLAAAGVTHVTLVDKEGILTKSSAQLNPYQEHLLSLFNKRESGDLSEAIVDQDVFIGLSTGNLLTKEMIRTMNDNPIIFALANPVPEVTPEEAKEGGAKLIATGSSDYPNQVNNVLAFPGLFAGLLEAKAKFVDEKLQLHVAKTLADLVENPTEDYFIPNVFETRVVPAVKQSVVNFFN